MLVLSRHAGESIIIGDDIVITVVSLGDGKVRLGISAPKHIAVDREEIRLRPDYRERGEGHQGEGSRP